MYGLEIGDHHLWYITSQDIPQFEWDIFGHIIYLDQLHMGINV